MRGSMQGVTMMKLNKTSLKMKMLDHW